MKVMKEDILFKVITDLVVFLAEVEASELNDDDMLSVVEDAISEMVKLPECQFEKLHRFLVEYSSSEIKIKDGVSNLIEALEINR